MILREVYQSPRYSPDKVTGRYVRRLSRRDGYGYRVAETATGTGRFAGKPGFGGTLREYDIDGSELPEAVRALADRVPAIPAWWPL